MAKKENYYEIEKKLYNIHLKMKNVSQENAYDIYSEGQSLIFEYDFFKEYYINKTREVLSDIKSGKYENIIVSNYNKVKKIAKNSLRKKNLKISFSDEKKYNNQKITYEYELNGSDFPQRITSFVQNTETIKKELQEDNSHLDNRSVIEVVEDNWYDYCSSYAKFIDIPSLFVYESLLSTRLNENPKESVNNFDVTIRHNIVDLYFAIFGCVGLEVQIPKNIEYLILAMNVGKYYFDTKFHLCIGLTSLNAVLNDYMNKIYNKLSKEYSFILPSPSQYNKKRHLIMLDETSDSFPITLDGIPVKGLSKKKLEDIKNIVLGKYEMKPDNVKSYISREINKHFLELVKDKNLYKQPQPFYCKREHEKYIFNREVYDFYHKFIDEQGREHLEQL